MEKDVVDYDFQSQLLEERKEKISERSEKMVFDEDYFLRDKPSWLKDLFKSIDSFCINEIKTGVKRNFLVTYVRYNYNNLMFCKMKSQLESLKVYLKLRYTEIENPQAWIRDYRKVSRQTWIEITIREEDLVRETIILDNLFDLIKQSFNRVAKSTKLSKAIVEKPAVKVLPGFLTPTKQEFKIELQTDGFCQLTVRSHKSQVMKILEKILE